MTQQGGLGGTLAHAPRDEVLVLPLVLSRLNNNTFISLFFFRISPREEKAAEILDLTRLLPGLLARAADGIAAHAARGPDRLAALADVAADLVRAALGLGEGAGLVFGPAGALEVTCFVRPAERGKRVSVML